MGQESSDTWLIKSESSKLDTCHGRIPTYVDSSSPHKSIVTRYLACVEVLEEWTLSMVEVQEDSEQVKVLMGQSWPKTGQAKVLMSQEWLVLGNGESLKE